MPETTRWGLLGAGQISRTQSLVLPAAEGADLFAVAARDIERAKALGAPRSYGSYADLIADPDVDAVYVGLPNDAHLRWVVEALREIDRGGVDPDAVSGGWDYGAAGRDDVVEQPPCFGDP